MDFEGNRDEDNGRKPQEYSDQEGERNKVDENEAENTNRTTAWEKAMIERLVKEGAKKARKRRLEKATNQAKELYDAFLKAGFSEKQALFLVSGLITFAGQKDE